MIKRNKYKMLAAALSTSFLLSACGSVNTETGSNNINLGYDGDYAQEYFEETSYPIIYNKIENVSQYVSEPIVWSPDDVSSVKCCGVDINLPCKFSDIDKSFNTEITQANAERVFDLDMVELFFNDEHIGVMCYEDNEYDIEKDYLNFLRLESFSLNGLTETSSKDDVQKKFGRGTKMDTEYVDAYWGDSIRLSFEYMGDKTAISIYVYEEEEK